MSFWVFCVGFYIGQFLLWAYVVMHTLARFVVVLCSIREPLSVTKCNVIFGVTVVLVMMYVGDTALLGVTGSWNSDDEGTSDSFVTSMIGATLLFGGWSHYYIMGSALCESPVGEPTAADPKRPTVYKLVQYELCQVRGCSLRARLRARVQVEGRSVTHL